MCRALLSGFLHHLENVILFIRTQVAFEMNFCVSVQECPAEGGGGGLMTTFGDLGNYVNGFTCSPQEI